MDRATTRQYELPLLVRAIAALAWFLVGRLYDVHTRFEEANLVSEETNLRVLILDQIAHRQVAGGPLPASMNPVVWAERAPANYLGELGEAPKDVTVWYFDTRRQVLVYRYSSGREALFRLVRGTDVANVAGTLGGIGLQRLADGQN
jgi:hypothetical protein